MFLIFSSQHHKHFTLRLQGLNHKPTGVAPAGFVSGVLS